MGAPQRMSSSDTAWLHMDRPDTDSELLLAALGDEVADLRQLAG